VPVRQRPLSLGSCRSALQASKHASPAGVRELAQRGRPWVRVGEAENLEVVRFGVALSIESDRGRSSIGASALVAVLAKCDTGGST